MKLFLIVTQGKHKGLVVPIKVDLFMIGTSNECQMRAKRTGIGEQHCCIITQDNKKVFVRDLDSGEPTLVNGEDVPSGGEWPLHAGDEDDVFNPVNRAIHNAADAASSILDQLQARRGVVRGRLRVGFEASITVIRFNDRYLVDEAELALVKKELLDHVSRPNIRVLLDFKNVRRMSSTAVEMLREVYLHIMRFGSKVALCRVRGELQGILRTLHLTESVKHFPDKKMALEGKW